MAKLDTGSEVTLISIHNVRKYLCTYKPSLPSDIVLQDFNTNIFMSLGKIKYNNQQRYHPLYVVEGN